MLRELQRNTTGAYVFETERGGPFTADAVNRLVKTIGERAQHTARYTELSPTRFKDVWR